MSDIWLNEGTYGFIGCSRWTLWLNKIIWYSGLLTSPLKNYNRFWDLFQIGWSLVIFFCFQIPIAFAITWRFVGTIGGRASNWWAKTWIKDRYICRTSCNSYMTDLLKCRNIGHFIVIQIKIIEICQVRLLRFSLSAFSTSTAAIFFCIS